MNDIRTCMIPKVTHTVGSKHTFSITPFEIKSHLRAICEKYYISRIHIYNVIVLNNINGDCLIATSKSITLECAVSDCVYVFKKVPKMATR